jgi:hypothetical protein
MNRGVAWRLLLLLLLVVVVVMVVVPHLPCGRG